MDLAFWFQVAADVVFVATMVSFMLAVLDRWSAKWFPSYPPSRFAHIVQALEDLCDQIGNVFKDKVAPRVWDGVDRRGDAK